MKFLWTIIKCALIKNETVDSTAPRSSQNSTVFSLIKVPSLLCKNYHTKFWTGLYPVFSTYFCWIPLFSLSVLHNSFNQPFILAHLDFTLIFHSSRPLVSMGIGSRTTPQIPKLAEAQVPYIKWHNICIQPMHIFLNTLIISRLLIMPNTM